MTDEEMLRNARLELAHEIRSNPDKSWMSSLMDRYKAFLREHGHSDEVAPFDEWHDGGVEIAEATMRSIGRLHGRAA